MPAADGGLAPAKNLGRRGNEHQGEDDPQRGGETGPQRGRQSAELGFDLAESVATLRDCPLDLVRWSVLNSTRQDIPRARYRSRAGRELGSYALPPSERWLMRWNGDPYELDGGAAGMAEDDGVYFLLPYWMARNHQFIVK